MADFSSALYLGMHHPVAALPAWSGLTLGKPAALEAPPGAAPLALELAALQGCEAATLTPSTLHLFWDLFAMLAQTGPPAPYERGVSGSRYVTLVDGGAYPVARWGAQYGAACGMPMQVFARNDADAAADLARHWRQRGRRPVLLADGYCPGAPSAPPLAAYAEIAASHGGLLVLDDTQVLGVMGEEGGGSSRAHALAGAPVLVGASLAKGFGAPLAALSGSRAWIARFEAGSRTRRHCSPPSVPVLLAARRALRLNRAQGKRLRRQLAQRVSQFRAGLGALGLSSRGGAFPVQALCLPQRMPALEVHAALAREDVRTVLQATRQGAVLSFLLRADHSERDIALALQALNQCMDGL